MASRKVPLSLTRIQKEKARRHLKHFVKLFWSVIEPGTELIWSWALDAVCDHLEAVSNGQIRDLVINIPPRHLKSTIVSVMWPAWEWLHKPEIRYLTASYDKQLAVRDAVRSRRILNSPLYLELNQDELGEQRFRLAGDQNVKSRYENNKTGHRICTSPSSAATGEGGNRIIVDDPHNVKEAQSDDQRIQVVEWWEQTMSTRRNNPKKDSRVVIMQRLHEDDLAGHCIEKGYEHVCLPLVYELEHPHSSRTSLHFVDPRTEAGQMLMPERMGPVEAAQAALDLGTYGYVGQMQQRPAPSEGGILKKGWFNRYSIEPPIDSFDRVITSWDLSFKGKDKTKRSELEAVKKRSWVVGITLGIKGANTWVLDLARGQWDIKEAMQAMLDMHAKWPRATGHLVEDKANGPAVETLLKDTVPGIILVTPKGSKIQRAYAAAPICEAGNVYLPVARLAPWIGDFLHEIVVFPFGKTDDQVDAFTQGLIHEQVDETNATIRALQKMVGNG